MDERGILEGEGRSSGHVPKHYQKYEKNNEIAIYFC